MKTVQVATHDGIFHADEIFALAALRLYLAKERREMKVIRTRDPKIIDQADMVVDVGGVYSRSKYRFDHHQKEKPGTHLNKIPYASFGLIWKHFGRKITSSKKVWEIIENKLVSPIDALDNGISLTTPIMEDLYEYATGQIFSAIAMAYEEADAGLAFEKALEIAGIILSGEIKKTELKIEGEKVVTTEISKQGVPEVLVLTKYYPWDSAVSKFLNIKLVIFPQKDSTNWCIQAVRDSLEIFGNDRISFPSDWRGLTNADLALRSGILESVFCHTGGFFAVASTLPGATEMARLAIVDFKKQSPA